MNPSLSVLTALLLAPLAALHAADNPFASAKAVWRMTTAEASARQPYALKENGRVKFEPLGVAEAVESRKRGGADTAATLTWNGVHAPPRTLEFDGRHLRQEPLPEFEALRGEHESKQNLTLTPDTRALIRTRGDAVEINAEFEPGDAKGFGLKLRVSADGARFVRVWFDTATGDCGVDGQVLHKGFGPSHLAEGQPVRMRAFVDKQVVETFVNGQTCTTIAQVKDTKASQPALSDGLDLFSEGGTARCTKLDVWKMNRAEPK